MKGYRRKRWVAWILVVVSLGVAWACYDDGMDAGSILALLYAAVGVAILMFDRKPKI